MSKKLPKKEPDTAEMSFFDHIEELRWHLLRSLVAILVFSVFAFIEITFIYDNIIMAPTRHSFITYEAFCKFGHLIGMGDKLCLGDVKLIFQNMKLSGQFLQAMSSSFIIGVIVSAPYIIWEFWRFIRPALRDGELKHTKGAVFWISLLFFMGVGFGYYVLTPYTVNFFAAFSISESIHNIITIKSYLSTIRQIVLGTGLLFELPALAYFLAQAGVITADTLRTYRKHALLVIIILGAIITPPDVASQIIVSIPLYGLYEISIWITKRVERKHKKRDEEEWA